LVAAEKTAVPVAGVFGEKVPILMELPLAVVQSTPVILVPTQKERVSPMLP